MAAIIQFPTGERATYEAGRWTSETPGLVDYIRAEESRVPFAYYPNPEGDHAAAVAELLGATLVSRGPYQDNTPEGGKN